MQITSLHLLFIVYLLPWEQSFFGLFRSLIHTRNLLQYSSLSLTVPNWRFLKIQLVFCWSGKRQFPGHMQQRQEPRNPIFKQFFCLQLLHHACPSRYPEPPHVCGLQGRALQLLTSYLLLPCSVFSALLSPSGLVHPRSSLQNVAQVSSTVVTLLSITVGSARVQSRQKTEHVVNLPNWPVLLTIWIPELAPFFSHSLAR